MKLASQRSGGPSTRDCGRSSRTSRPWRGRRSRGPSRRRTRVRVNAYTKLPSVRRRKSPWSGRSSSSLATVGTVGNPDKLFQGSAGNAVLFPQTRRAPIGRRALIRRFQSRRRLSGDRGEMPAAGQRPEFAPPPSTELRACPSRHGCVRLDSFQWMGLRAAPDPFHSNLVETGNPEISNPASLAVPAARAS